jgi:hypothetical protein
MATAETDRYVLLLEISDCLGSESIWGSRIIAFRSARSATSGELNWPDHSGVGYTNSKEEPIILSPIREPS